VRTEPAAAAAVRSCASRAQRGFIVVAVLWILAALSALVLIYMGYVTSTAVVVAGGTDRIEVDALVSAGVELAAYQLTAVAEKARPTSGTFDARLGKGRLTVTFRSEAARIDLNAAPKSLLAGLMIGIGVAPSNAADYADRILAWRAAPREGGEDPEDSLYRASGVPYLPRHAPFPTAEELWLVHGIPRQVVDRMLPFVTVYSNLRSVNILDAAPQVLAALPGMTPMHLQELLSERNDPRYDPRSVLTDAGGENATIEGSKAYRITVSAVAGGRPAHTAEAVVLLLDGGNDPYRVLSWRNDYDGSAGKPL
jgi:general secretion pathway protein K